MNFLTAVAGADPEVPENYREINLKFQAETALIQTIFNHRN